MPDRRRHRGPHPEDHRLFRAAALPVLRDAVSDLAWLETRGYAEKSALQIVGNRYQLTERQRSAVLRCACSDGARRLRRQREITNDTDVDGARVEVDGYNLLITIESALSGGVVLVGRDGCYRDLASLHGNYRAVEETRPAIESVAAVLEELSPDAVTWYLDAPVSNSGRLAGVIRDLARDGGWPWEVHLVPDPDRTLVASHEVVVSADSAILDGCERWLDLARLVVTRRVPDAWVLHLHTETDEER